MAKRLLTLISSNMGEPHIAQGRVTSRDKDVIRVDFGGDVPSLIRGKIPNEVVEGDDIAVFNFGPVEQVIMRIGGTSPVDIEPSPVDESDEIVLYKTRKQLAAHLADMGDTPTAVLKEWGLTKGAIMGPGRSKPSEDVAQVVWENSNLAFTSNGRDPAPFLKK